MDQPPLPPGYRIDPEQSRQYGVPVAVNDQGKRIRMTGPQPKLTQDQGQAQGYAKLMADAETAYRKAVEQGYDPATARNAVASFLEGLPFGGLDGAGALVRDDISDVGRQAELQWSDAQLRAMSGAAAPEGEVKRNVRTYFPRPGENIDAVGSRKEQARATAFDAARRRSGPASSEIVPPNGGGPRRLRYDPKTGRLVDAN